MSSALYYFAYGSNMLTHRLRERVRSALPISAAVLRNHRLAWHKQGIDGSGKCDIIEAAGNDTRQVHGVLYEMDAEEQSRLDKAEQLGTGYARKSVKVATESGTYLPFTYQALMKDQSLVPYRWYKQLVVAGAREHRLPADYINELRQANAVRDSDGRRIRKAKKIINMA